MKKNKSNPVEQFIGSRFTKNDILYSFIITITFFITRIFNLRLWPIFTDEAIYTRWSQIALNDAAFRFISLTDGKQPLWHWFTIASMKIFSDPLIAGRITSVAAGFFGMVGIWFLAFELMQRKKIAYIASIFYLLTPFTLFYDRIALVDSMLTMWGIWTLYFGIKTAKLVRLDLAMITGFMMGAGLLTKSPAVFFQYLYPLTFLFITKKKNISKWLILSIPTLLIAEAMRNILRLSPWMYLIGRKNVEFIVTYQEFLEEPFRWFWGNLPSLTRWWTGWLTWPVALVSIISFIFVLLPTHFSLSLRKKWRQMLVLFIFSLLPLMTAAALGKVIFARYLLFVTPMLLIATATGTHLILDFVKKKNAKIVFILFLSVSALFIDYKILTNPIEAPIISADRDQYVDGFPAGWGVDEVISFLKQESSDKKIFLGTQGTFGLMPYSFELYLWDNPNIQINGYWPVSEVPEEVVEKSKELPSYFIYYESLEEQIPAQQNIELIKKFRKGKSERFMYLYQVFPHAG